MSRTAQRCRSRCTPDKAWRPWTSFWDDCARPCCAMSKRFEPRKPCAKSTGVGKLRRISRKQKKDSSLAEQIEEVRCEKQEARAEFVRLRDSVTGYLASPAWQRPEIIAQINDIDQVFAGATEAGLAARVTYEANAVELRRAQVAKMDKLAVSLELSEAKFHRLLREVSPLAEAGIGSKDFAFNFSLGGGFLGFASASGGISYSGSVNIQDDLRLRVTRTWGVSGGASAELAAVLSADASIGFGRSTTEVFVDADHWAASMAFRLGTIQTMLKRLGRGEDFDPKAAAQEMYGQDDAGELMLTKGIAEHDSVTQVTSYSGGGSVSGSLLGYGASVGYSRTRMIFEKDGADGARLQRTGTQGQLTFSLSAGKLSATFTRTDIRGHANPDNDGIYWNTKLALGTEAAAKLSVASDADKAAWLEDLETKLLDRLDATEAEESAGGFSLAEKELAEGSKTALQDGHSGDFARGLAEYLDRAALSLDAKIQVPYLSEIGVVGSGQVAVEWNVLWNSGEQARLQYRRFGEGLDAGIAGSVQAGPTPLTIGFDASMGQSTMTSQTLGSDTTTLLQTVFNALRLRDNRDFELGRQRQARAQWNAYVGEHRPEIWALFGRIASGRSKALDEIQSAQNDARDLVREYPDKAPAVVGAAQQFLIVCDSYSETLAATAIDDESFDELSGLLTEYFEKLALLAADVQAGEWREVTPGTTTA